MITAEHKHRSERSLVTAFYLHNAEHARSSGLSQARPSQTRTRTKGPYAFEIGSRGGRGWCGDCSFQRMQDVRTRVEKAETQRRNVGIRRTGRADPRS